MTIFLMIWVWILIWIWVNMLICFGYDLSHEVGKQVGPQWSVCFFPLFIYKFNRHQFKTIDDKVNETMTKIYGPGWKTW
jgi:hypothetical protein